MFKLWVRIMPFNMVRCHGCASGSWMQDSWHALGWIQSIKNNKKTQFIMIIWCFFVSFFVEFSHLLKCEKMRFRKLTSETPENPIPNEPKPANKYSWPTSILSRLLLILGLFISCSLIVYGDSIFHVKLPNLRKLKV